MYTGIKLLGNIQYPKKLTGITLKNNKKMYFALPGSPELLYFTRLTRGAGPAKGMSCATTVSI